MQLPIDHILVKAAAETLKDTTDEVIVRLVQALELGLDALNDPDRQLYVAYAREHLGRDGVIEIDDDAIISGSDDDGEYVQAWLWVHASDVGLATEDDANEE